MGLLLVCSSTVFLHSLMTPSEGLKIDKNWQIGWEAAVVEGYQEIAQALLYQ